MPGWYYLIDGAVKGPVSHNAISEMIRSGQITPDTLAWAKSIDRWTLVKYIKPFKNLFPGKLSTGTKSKRQTISHGLPIISLFGLIRSYDQLRGKWKKTSWDLHGGHVVRHKKLNFIGVATVVIVLSGIVLLNYL